MKIEVVPRIRIDGKYHRVDELPEEERRQIIESRIDLAMKGMNYERKKTA